MAAATTADADADAARDGQTALAKHLAPPPPAAAAATNNHNHNVAFSPVSVHAGAAARLPRRPVSRGARRLWPPRRGPRPRRPLRRRRAAGALRRRRLGGRRLPLTDAFRDVAAEAYKSEARTVSFTDEVSRLD